MSEATRVSTVTLTDRSPESTRADALVLGTVKTDAGAALVDGHGLKAKAAKKVAEVIDAMRLTGDADEVVRLGAVDGIDATCVVTTGLGKAADVDTETLRRAAGAAVRFLAGRNRVVVALPTSTEHEVAAVTEGAAIGNYAFHNFLGEKHERRTKKAVIENVEIVVSKAKDKATKAAAERAVSVAAGVAYARDLVNTPPNVLYPETFAESVKRRAKGTKVSIEIMDEAELEKAGCGGIVGVGQGSVHAPRIAKMTYKPRGAKQHIALVGKGITFDSGGLSLKPADGMITMKCDMGGAAAVAGSVLAIAELGVPVAVTAYLCLAENMPDANAQRPGDVVTMRNGKTVEIINTDAEGRLAMADGLSLASEIQPDLVVDIATLTGAAVVALGERTFAVMGNTDESRERVHACASVAGESSWPLPLAAELRAQLESEVADLKHTAGRAGGTMSAGRFLQEFVGKDKAGQQLPWAHIDIAGPAFTDKAHGYNGKGGTGVGVRTLIALAESYAAK